MLLSFVLLLFFTMLLMMMDYLKMLPLIMLVEMLGLMLLLSFFMMMKSMKTISYELGVYFLWIFVCESCIMLTFFVLFFRKKNLSFLSIFNL
uniref:NADH dehydrogenase subunit 4L n=1 Tax=Intoshia linei TaxID=1819745 RepID=UPI001EDFEA57|nr:NADH dehydrogenase subunit 4L [Intoshia linei]UIB41620.1 NADH dehydrogenase subunit 4L [Intoshia linei]